MRDYPRDVRLLGGYFAKLTNAQQNAWGKYLYASPEFAVHEKSKLRAIKATAALNQSATADAMREFDEAYTACAAGEALLFDLGEKWVAENVKQGDDV